jgi:hypothetical protein
MPVRACAGRVFPRAGLRDGRQLRHVHRGRQRVRQARASPSVSACPTAGHRALGPAGIPQHHPERGADPHQHVFHLHLSECGECGAGGTGHTTYFFFGNRSPLSHLAGSSMIFMTGANAALIAILAGLLMTLLGWARQRRSSSELRAAWRSWESRLSMATAVTPASGAGSPRFPPPRRPETEAGQPETEAGQSMAAISSTTRSRNASTWASSYPSLPTAGRKTARRTLSTLSGLSCSR